ncbi:MAG: hypothetical protein WC819_00900 [Parcubacteria group bacterium]|jgi:hypothetical protein
MCDRKDVYKLVEAIARAKMHLSVKQMDHSKECNASEGRGCICGAERVNDAIKKATEELSIDRMKF